MKKVMKFFALAFLMLLSLSVFCQDTAAVDTTTVTSPGIIAGLSWTMILGIVVGIYEVLVRYIPTVSNISIVSFIMGLLKKLVPNKATDGSLHD